MSNFRETQQQAHPRNRSTIMSVLIVVLIFNLTLQVWLLYVTLNNALAENKGIAIPAFVASFVIFLVGALWLYFLPEK
ncbi:MAG: DUF6755 family protein [Saprospiraceae bacterium]